MAGTPGAAPVIPPPLLDVRELQLALGGRPVLRGAELALPPGTFTGLIGPNGSGKSTLLRCLAGILPPTGGSVRVRGHDPATDPQAAKTQLGYAPDPASLPDVLRGCDCLELFARARGLAAAIPPATQALADALQFTPWLQREVGTYSLGTRQKLSVLLGLLGEPPLLLLDESLNGLDPVSAFRLKQHLRQLADRGATVLLATHGIELAEHHLDRVLLLDDGRITAQWDRTALDALRAQPGGLEAAVVAAL